MSYPLGKATRQDTNWKAVAVLTSLGGSLFGDWTHPSHRGASPKVELFVHKNKVASPYRFLLLFRFLGDRLGVKL